MNKGRILVLGGAPSGKSRMVEEIVEGSGLARFYLATAEAPTMSDIDAVDGSSTGIATSGYGTKRTSVPWMATSAFGGKADMTSPI
jgi:hypothetical protein